MAKGKNVKHKKAVGKKARTLQRQIKEDRSAVVNGLADSLMKELDKRLNGSAA